MKTMHASKTAGTVSWLDAELHHAESAGGALLSSAGCIELITASCRVYQAQVECLSQLLHSSQACAPALRSSRVSIYVTQHVLHCLALSSNQVRVQAAVVAVPAAACMWHYCRCQHHSTNHESAAHRKLLRQSLCPMLPQATRCQRLLATHQSATAAPNAATGSRMELSEDQLREIISGMSVLQVPQVPIMITATMTKDNKIQYAGVSHTCTAC